MTSGHSKERVQACVSNTGKLVLPMYVHIDK